MLKDFSFFLIPCDGNGKPIAGEKVIDIESDFKAYYRSMTGLGDMGEVKNTYSEDYAESSVLRTFFPPVSAITHKSTTHDLNLYFKGDDCYARSIAFGNEVMGRRFLWYDNFRHRFAMVALNKQPKENNKRLYGISKFRDMTYTFDDLSGGTETAEIVETTLNGVKVGDFICSIVIEPKEGTATTATAGITIDNGAAILSNLGLRIEHPHTHNNVQMLTAKGLATGISAKTFSRYSNLIVGSVKSKSGVFPAVFENCVSVAVLKYG